MATAAGHECAGECRVLVRVESGDDAGDVLILDSVDCRKYYHVSGEDVSVPLIFSTDPSLVIPLTYCTALAWGATMQELRGNAYDYVEEVSRIHGQCVSEGLAALGLPVSAESQVEVYGDEGDEDDDLGESDLPCSSSNSSVLEDGKECAPAGAESEVDEFELPPEPPARTPHSPPSSPDEFDMYMYERKLARFRPKEDFDLPPLPPSKKNARKIGDSDEDMDDFDIEFEETMRQKRVRQGGSNVRDV